MFIAEKHGCPLLSVNKGTIGPALLGTNHQEADDERTFPTYADYL